MCGVLRTATQDVMLDDRNIKKIPSETTSLVWLRNTSDWRFLIFLGKRVIGLEAVGWRDSEIMRKRPMGCGISSQQRTMFGSKAKGKDLPETSTSQERDKRRKKRLTESNTFYRQLSFNFLLNIDNTVRHVYIYNYVVSRFKFFNYNHDIKFVI